MSTKKASAANGGKNQILERDEAEFAISAASSQDNIYLTAAAGNGKVCFPNIRGHIKRPALAQQGAKDLTATAYHIRSDERFKILAGLQRPYVCEATAAFEWPGSVVCPAFPFNPKTFEVSK